MCMTWQGQIQKLTMLTSPLNLIQVVDWEPLTNSPCESKHRALYTNLQRSIIDYSLKPTVAQKTILNKIIQHPRNVITEAEGDMLWQFRFSLVDDGGALPKFLLCVDWSSNDETVQATELLSHWRSRSRITITDALRLLGGENAYRRRAVRGFAVDTLRRCTDEELVLYLLQLVMAVKYDVVAAAATEEEEEEEEEGEEEEGEEGDGAEKADGEKQDGRAGEEGQDVERDARERNAKRTGAGSCSVCAPLHASVRPFCSHMCATDALTGKSSALASDSLGSFLVSRSAKNMSMANYLFWYLKVEMTDLKYGHVYTAVFEELKRALTSSPAYHRDPTLSSTANSVEPTPTPDKDKGDVSGSNVFENMGNMLTSIKTKLENPNVGDGEAASHAQRSKRSSSTEAMLDMWTLMEEQVSSAPRRHPLCSPLLALTGRRRSRSSWELWGARSRRVTPRGRRRPRRRSCGSA